MSRAGRLTFRDVTGLIYVAIVALWAAVLIPMWLKRHDEDQSRRIDRHRDAIGTLARIRSESRSSVSPATRRRRVVLAGLAAIAVAAATGYVFGLVGLWAPIAAAGLIVAFFAFASYSRHAEIRRRAEAALRRSAQARAARQAEMDAHRERMRQELRVARPSPAEPAPVAREQRRAGRTTRWNQVFDQTA